VTVRRLARLDDPPAPLGLGGADHPMRVVTRESVADPATWTAERQSGTRAYFDELAPDWDARFAGEPRRHAPLVDALDRGGPFVAGPVLDVGSGTGAQTAVLADRLGHVVAVDLSLEMLRHAPAALGARVQADAVRLPLRDASISVAVVVNAFLFPAELVRVLVPGGAVVWVSSAGADTPIYLPADDVAAALGPGWGGVWSEANTGSWAVLRRG
jgi:protein-L-isoaspartate O-methyltransferase